MSKYGYQVSSSDDWHINVYKCACCIGAKFEVSNTEEKCGKTNTLTKCSIQHKLNISCAYEHYIGTYVSKILNLSDKSVVCMT